MPSQSSSSLTGIARENALTDLLYFTCDFENRRYGGWYRFIPGAQLEVIARGRVKSAECGDDIFPQDLACELLTEIVRETRDVVSDADWPGFPITQS